MGFVDGDETELHVAQLAEEDFSLKSLGGDVEEFVLSVDGVVEGGDEVVVVESGVECEGFDVSGTQVFYLVFHECNEGGDDEAKARHGHGGDLERQ